MSKNYGYGAKSVYLRNKLRFDGNIFFSSNTLDGTNNAENSLHLIMSYLDVIYALQLF